jgi:hypothetical protein
MLDSDLDTIHGVVMRSSIFERDQTALVNIAIIRTNDAIKLKFKLMIFKNYLFDSLNSYL